MIVVVFQVPMNESHPIKPPEVQQTQHGPTDAGLFFTAK
jgi:hypothetical protein